MSMNGMGNHPAGKNPGHADYWELAGGNALGSLIAFPCVHFIHIDVGERIEDLVIDDKRVAVLLQFHHIYNLGPTNGKIFAGIIAKQGDCAQVVGGRFRC